MEKNSGCFSFIKLLKDEDFSKEIQIPDSFVKKHSKELSRSYILLDTQSEISWTVKIRCSKETHRRYYYMCDGEWSFFVKFYDLKYGDYLLFFLIDDNVFKVIPYGADCCPKFSSYRRRNLESHQSISDDSLNDDDADDDDDDGDEEEEEKEDDGVIHKRRRRVFDSRTNQNNKKKKTKVEHGTGHSKRSQNFKKSKVVESCPPGSSSRSKSGSRGSGAFMDLNAKDPFCIMTIKRHNRRFMTIPKAFAEKTSIGEEENVILRGKDNREWAVGIKNTEDGRVNMMSGWHDFYKGYGLEEGDSCKFTHMMMNNDKGSEKITLLVEVPREIIHP